MNSIPLIFNEHPVNCTILGGRKNNSFAKIPISVILLNNGANYMRAQNLEHLVRCGFSQIVSLENNVENYNLDDFVQNFPSVRFILPLEKTSIGELINKGMEEVSTEYVLVLNDALRISSQIMTEALSQKFLETEFYCIVPRLFACDSQPLPLRFSPVIVNSILKVNASSVVTDKCTTLYPFDFIGLYNREKFISLGGYDYTIKSSYWQNLDLSFRAWLWGEEIRISTTFGLSYSAFVTMENSTPDLGELRFFLKNMTPRFRDDHGEISFSSFYSFYSHSECGIIETMRQFSDAKNWVQKNQFRFKTDASALIKNWGE